MTGSRGRGGRGHSSFGTPPPHPTPPHPPSLPRQQMPILRMTPHSRAGPGAYGPAGTANGKHVGRWECSGAEQRPHLAVGRASKTYHREHSGSEGKEGLSLGQKKKKEAGLQYTWTQQWTSSAVDYRAVDHRPPSVRLQPSSVSRTPATKGLRLS